MVSLSWREAGEYPKTAEDDLLEKTSKAMRENPDFIVGCKTSRSNI